MMKSFTRIAALLLAVALAVLCAACTPAAPVTTPSASPNSAAPTDAPSGAPEEPPAGFRDEKVTFTYFMEAVANAHMETMNDSLMYKIIEEDLNIELQFIHAAQGEFATELGLLIAAQDLPDFIEGFSYVKGPDAAISDGLILQLNDLAQNYAPDLMALLQSDREIWRQTATDDGVLWSIPSIQPINAPAWHGLSMRKDLLDTLGLAVPETLGELEAAALRMKDELGVSFAINENFNVPGFSTEAHRYVSAFGIGTHFYRDLSDRSVKFGPMQDAYLDFLTMMNRWYDLGIIDRDWYVRTGEDRAAAIANGDIVVFSDGRGGTQNMLNNGRAVDPDFDLVQLPGLVLNKGDKINARQLDTIYKMNDLVITTANRNPERAMDFINYGFTEKGIYLYNYGIEGVTYNLVNGKVELTDVFYDDDVIGPWGQIRQIYKRHVPPAHRIWDAEPFSEFFLHISNVWSEGGVDLLMPPRLSLTLDESAIYNPAIAEVNTHVNENIVKFITGERALSEFDSFRDELRNMGIEQCTEIQQAATTRYDSK